MFLSCVRLMIEISQQSNDYCRWLLATETDKPSLLLSVRSLEARDECEFQIFCIGYFAHECDQIGEKNNLRKERGYLASGQRVQSITAQKATRTGGSWELTSQQLKKAEGRCWIALLSFPSSFNPGSYQKNTMQTTFKVRASLLNYLFPRSLKDRHIQSHALLMA